MSLITGSNFFVSMSYINLVSEGIPNHKNSERHQIRRIRLPVIGCAKELIWDT